MEKEKEEISLDDVPCGDYYQMIYRLEDDEERQAYVYINVNPRIDENGQYHLITFRDMMDEIEKKHKKKISTFVMLSEFGLEGVVYRYNNYSDGKIYEWGTTKGYA